jgi:ubiquinone/menaquinone biosynthesis C-methylase UbiE
MFRLIGFILVGLPAMALVLHTIVRIIRYYYKFPMPEFMANLIDNPLRRRMQPPDEVARRHGITPGMTVLDVGPGNGTYTMAAARLLGENGRLYAIDIEPKMIERVQARMQLENLKNIEARVADAFALPFEDSYFDLVYLITVIGEIPTPEKAFGEFCRVLKPGGTLAFSELFTDPDYMLAATLKRKVEPAGFRFIEQTGSFFNYTLRFEKK